MQHPSWMLVRLALETRVHHPLADADRLSLMEAPSATRYRHHLVRVWGFESQVEAALAAVPELDRELVQARAKAHLIETDLRELGMHEAQLADLPRCPVRPFRSVVPALGWLFVVERNTLVHGLLQRQLVAAIPEVARRATTYLSWYGNTPGARYRELGEYVDQIARAPAIPNQIVQAAHDAFRSQHQWFASGASSAALAS